MLFRIIYDFYLKKFLNFGFLRIFLSLLLRSPLGMEPMWPVSTDTDSCIQSRRRSVSPTSHPPSTFTPSATHLSPHHLRALAFPGMPSHPDWQIRSDAPQGRLHISHRFVCRMGSFLHIPSPSTCFHSVICLHSAAISLTISIPSQYFDLPLKICRVAMAKLVLLFALFVLPAIAVAARPTRHPLVVKGKVYCDPCRAGFETSASTFIAGNAVSPVRSPISCSDSFMKLWNGDCWSAGLTDSRSAAE